MKEMMKGILVVLTTLALWAMACNVHAGTPAELNSLIADKGVVYVGTCYFTDKGQLTFKRDEMKREVKCVVGMTPDDPHTHYVLKYTDDMVEYELISYQDQKKVQKTLWRRGKEA